MNEIKQAKLTISGADDMRAIFAHADPPQLRDGAWLEFSKPREVVEVTALDQFPAAWARLRAAVDAGNYIAGWLAYEAAPFFDPAFAVHASESGAPLACFGIFAAPKTLHALAQSSDSCRISAWAPALERAAYDAAVERIRALIAAGDTYQVNFSFPLEAQFEGDPLAAFAALTRAQGAAQGALLLAPRRAIVSASPELFFQQDGSALLTRPMKGTAPRGRWQEEDAARAEALQSSAKDRAENIMIVDMLRNDLGRVASEGSIKAGPLFELERYETVWQMTSTIRAQTDGDPFETLAALFPCASITGAPKIRTMQIIRDLENRPRGAYTGAIGWIGPGRRAWFNVAIRTMEISTDGRAAYGVGGGVTWDSKPESEYKECVDKAAILLRPRPEFDLLETMRWDPAPDSPLGCFQLWPRHAARLAASATYFGYPCDLKKISAALSDWAASGVQGPQWVRLMLARDGGARVTSQPLPPSPLPNLDEPFSATAPIFKIAFAPAPVDASDVMLYHKSTHRELYERSLAACPGADAALLLNDRGEITEASMANVIIETPEGSRLTPARACGLLAGTMREELLARRLIEEAVLRREDLACARRIWLSTAVRGVFPAEFI